MVALVFNALPDAGFQVNVFPLCIVAIKILPKLSKDQLAGSIVTVLDAEASPQPTKCPCGVGCVAHIFRTNS